MHTEEKDARNPAPTFELSEEKCTRMIPVVDVTVGAGSDPDICRYGVVCQRFQCRLRGFGWCRLREVAWFWLAGLGL